MRKYLIAIFVLTMTTLAAAESVRSQPKSPEINLNKQIEKSIEKPKTADQINHSANIQPSAIPQPITTIEKPTTETKKDNRGDDRPEFYITICGFGLKITDLLMIALTGALAWYTRRLNCATEKLWEAGEKQMQITNKSLKLARDEFNATHRPKIIIHTLKREYRPDHTMGVICTYINIGTTTARISEIETNVFLSGNSTAENSAILETFDSKTLESGEKCIHQIKSNISDMNAILSDTMFRRGQSDQRIICAGRIKYQDMQGVSRETGFYRLYDIDKEKWQREDNTDHEYSY